VHGATGTTFAGLIVTIHIHVHRWRAARPPEAREQAWNTARMSSRPKRSTLHDVAREANVSYQTVSRVINNSPNVASKTRSRVMRVMRDLNYRPNRAAQMLSTRRSHIIELITLDVYSLHSDMLSAMITAARRLGYQVTVTSVAADDFVPVVSSAPSRLVDGLVIISQRLGMRDDELHALLHDIPYVKIVGEVGTRSATVTYDQHLGARLATQHLIDLGHRHIAEISGMLEIYDGAARHQSFLATLAAAGLAPAGSLEGRFFHEGGYRAMHALLDQNPAITAVFAGNDDMAVGAMYALHERGLRVPDDLSLVGYDDGNAARFQRPPLTTVRQEPSLIGQLTIEHLVDFIQNPERPIHQRVLMPELVVRQSTRRLE
jgi:LacI family transcriptional regulator